MKLTLRTIIIVTICVLSAKGGGFDDLGYSARAAAMGGTGIALHGATYAQFYNPAAIYSVSNLSFYTTYSNLFPGVEDDNLNYFTLCGIIPMNVVGTLGAGATFLNTELWKEYTFSGTYARELYGGFSVGASLKLLGWSAEAAPGESALSYTGLSFDAGAFYVLPDVISDFDLQAGLAARNINQPNISKSGAADAVLPMQIGLGAAMNSRTYGYTVAVDIVKERDVYAIKSGAEFLAFSGEVFALKTSLSLRLGYHDILKSDYAKERGISAGFGLTMDQYAVDYAFDYPFILQHAGSNHRVSIYFNL
jgi:hypothetical protein